MNPNEIIADIANEIRGYFDLLKRGLIPDNVARMTTRQRHQFWADRIEAAKKREQADLADAHDAIARLEAELAEVRRERDSCAAENSLLARAPGNAAALREALEVCTHEMCERCDSYMADNMQTHKPCPGCVIVDKARAALAAPARNADRFATANDAEEGYIAAHPHDDEPDASTYGSWLFAPAAERKGENK